MPVDLGSDCDSPDLNNIYLNGLDRNVLCQFLGTVYQMVVLFCSSIPAVSFDTPGRSKGLNTVFLLGPRFFFTIGLYL